MIFETSFVRGMNLKRLICYLLVICLIAVIPLTIASAAENTIHLLTLKLSIDPPQGWTVFTREIKENDPALTELNIDKDTLIKNMISGNVYFSALSEDQDTEINVSMTTSAQISKVYDLNLLEEETFAEMEQEYVAQRKRRGAFVTQFSKHSHKQATFIIVDYYQEFQRGFAYARDYITIINGQAITISLNTFSGDITSELASILQATVDSVVFSEVTEKPAFSVDSLVYGMLGVFFFIAAGIFIKIRLSRRDKKDKPFKDGNALKNKYTRW